HGRLRRGRGAPGGRGRRGPGGQRHRGPRRGAGRRPREAAAAGVRRRRVLHCGGDGAVVRSRQGPERAGPTAGPHRRRGSIAISPCTL
ncbi:unnamed protein product, partial [Prorocentrum cordatum]